MVVWFQIPECELKGIVARMGSGRGDTTVTFKRFYEQIASDYNRYGPPSDRRDPPTSSSTFDVVGHIEKAGHMCATPSSYPVPSPAVSATGSASNIMRSEDWSLACDNAANQSETRPEVMTSSEFRSHGIFAPLPVQRPPRVVPGNGVHGNPLSTQGGSSTVDMTTPAYLPSPAAGDGPMDAAQPRMETTAASHVPLMSVPVTGTNQVRQELTRAEMQNPETQGINL